MVIGDDDAILDVQWDGKYEYYSKTTRCTSETGILLCIDSVEFITRVQSHYDTWNNLKSSIANKNVSNKMACLVNKQMKYADLKNNEKQ